MDIDIDMLRDRTGHSQRLLSMYDVLQRGCGLSTRSLQERFGVTAKSVQRDIAELREYISQEYAQSVYGNIEYNRVRKEYYWRNRSDMLLHEKEILLLVTILMESRGLTKEELNRPRGAKMWFLSQAEFLEVMEPADFRQEMQETISRMLGNYQEQVQLP